MPLVLAALDRLAALFRHRDRDVRRLVVLGSVLFASGLAYLAWWIAQGQPSLAGPVSLRKPIVFGLSGGVATLSVAWLASLLPSSDFRARWTRVYSVTMALEILLIDAQQWRGVGSHFNVAAPLDGAIFTLMGILILVSMASAFFLGLRASRTPELAADVRVAAGLGTASLVAGSVVGIAMSVYGSIRTSMGLPPVIVGAGGDLKVVHAVALHGLQVLPMLGWVLARRLSSIELRRRLLLVAGAGYGLVFVAVVVQALLGLPPAAPVPVVTLLAGAGLALLAAPLFVVDTDGTRVVAHGAA